MTRYYSRLRPVGPGTYPRNGARDIQNYDDRQYVADAGCEVWGHIDYDRVLTPEEASSYDLVPGGKADDVKILSVLVGLEAQLFYAKNVRPELAYAYAYLRAACDEFSHATGITELDGKEEPEPTLTLNFTVKRNSVSTTQQYAEVYCNGELITSFGDDKKIIRPGEKYYGFLSGGCWGSTKPDAQFIKGTMFPMYDLDQRLTGGLRKIIDREIEREIEHAQRREEL